MLSSRQSWLVVVPILVVALASVPDIARGANFLLIGVDPTREPQVLMNAGHSATVATAANWASYAAIVSSFDALIVGDEGCAGPSTATLQAIYATRATWGPSISGNVVVAATDAWCHAAATSNALQFSLQAAEWAASGDGTGAFFSSDWGRRGLDYLEPLGGFNSVLQHGDLVDVVDPTHPVLAGLTSAEMSNWGNAHHTIIGLYPNSFVEIASTPTGDAIVVVSNEPTSVSNSPPRELALHSNVPNPFNPETSIRYDVPMSGAHVSIVVHDVTGRRVRILVDEYRSAGRWSVRWNGENAHGRRVPSGVYFCRMQAGNFVATSKMVLLT